MAANSIKSQQVSFGDGWQPANESWAYASADDPTFTFTISGVDLTTKYSPGMRVKLTQTTVKYFIITAVAFSTNTTITVYGGTDYDLANAAITLPYYSTQKAPQAFPLDPTKWSVIVANTTTTTQANPTAGTWYNLGSVSIAIPIGIWNTDYQVMGRVRDNSAESGQGVFTLSTANNSESDKELSAFIYKYAAGATDSIIYGHMTRMKVIALVAKATYYLNAQVSSGTSTELAVQNGISTCVIRAICAYL